MREGRFNPEQMMANKEMMKKDALSDAARAAEAKKAAEAGEAEETGKWEKHTSMGVEFDLDEGNASKEESENN